MKTIISTLLIMTTATVVFSSSRPEVLLSSPQIEVVTVESLAIFKSTNYDNETNNLVFETKENISFIQIFSIDNELQFQLPIMSSNVQINKNLFEVGEYKVGFMLVGDSKVHFTKVKIK